MKHLILISCLFFASVGWSQLVKIKTNVGSIEIKLDAKKAPITVKNFLSYVDDKFYDRTIFHRVIEGFMVQGGGFILKNDQLTLKKTKGAIKNEAKNGLKNLRGTVAMARAQAPHSATAQFFINHKSNSNLNFSSLIIGGMPYLVKS